MELKSYILDESAVSRALKRIAFQIAEKNKGYDDVVFVGILRRGLPLAARVAAFVREMEGIDVPLGQVDISAYRDDEKRNGGADGTEIPFDIEGKTVVLFDDVLHTGRTVRAAIDALFAVGRPQIIQLAVLVDRGHRELPIRADYVGKNIPTSSSENVVVSVPEIDGETSVAIYSI